MGLDRFIGFLQPVVEACARLGTHYVDFTTETPWIEDMVVRYAEMARKSGALIIHGLFTYTPSDIIAFLIAKELRERDNLRPTEIICSGKLDIKAMTAGSITTVLDLFATYGSKWYLWGDSWILSTLRPNIIPKPPWMTRLFGYRRINGLGPLSTSFAGPGNEAMVHRSASQWPDLYGPGFHYEEYLPVDGIFAILHWLTKTVLVLLSLPIFRGVIRTFVARKAPAPDVNKLRHLESMEFRAIGRVGSDDSPRAWASFTHQGSLYELTALVTCVGALCLLDPTIELEKSGGECHGSGGFVTPSYLGMGYVDRLRDAGVNIEVGRIYI
ncbi:hypothetical protein BO71DRAFT_147379 [Aspergillus ellipticus CBS 707.79]|uniref:Saccharopine dehydrogenase NADP binding domain-containing protein n=1 Tax=Aspergillus ellipticus CBS 707.79 TaxID=1448320 RepID=A0A319CTU1_9EURO|nr:hypothetical protein BO71DRAFT_147379 [Aspergillus ellipticus CBS 707.79]